LLIRNIIDQSERKNMKHNTEKYLLLLEDLDYLSALNFFEDQLAKKTNDLEIHHSGLAICYSRNNKLSESKEAISKAQQFGRVTFLTNIALGLIAEKEGDFILAEKEYEKAVKTGNNISYSWFMYGTFLLSQKRYNEGMEILLQAEKLNNISWASKVNLAHLYFQLGKYMLAFKYAGSAFILKPNPLTLQVVASCFSKAFSWLPLTLLLVGLLALTIYPHSVGPLILLSSVGVFFSIIAYLATRKKTLLFLGLFLVLSCILYFVAYVN